MTRRNVELKARLASLEGARRIAQSLTRQPAMIERQVDTYFHCPTGRLKLREINGEIAVLIGYSRPDQAEAKLSRYHLAPVSDAQAAKQLLADALGIERIVTKTREIYRYQNVRIHLDAVEGLGNFLEFEAVLAEDQDSADGERLVGELRRRFGITPDDLVENSYGDLA